MIPGSSQSLSLLGAQPSGNAQGDKAEPQQETVSLEDAFRKIVTVLSEETDGSDFDQAADAEAAGNDAEEEADAPDPQSAQDAQLASMNEADVEIVQEQSTEGVDDQALRNPEAFNPTPVIRTSLTPATETPSEEQVESAQALQAQPGLGIAAIQAEAETAGSTAIPVETRPRPETTQRALALARYTPERTGPMVPLVTSPDENIDLPFNASKLAAAENQPLQTLPPTAEVTKPVYQRPDAAVRSDNRAAFVDIESDTVEPTIEEDVRQTSNQQSREASQPRPGTAQAPVLRAGETIVSMVRDPQVITQASGATDRVAVPVQASASPQAANVQATGAIQQIVHASQQSNGARRVEVLLDPPELGQMEISMELTEDGIKANLTAERQSTFDLLRRHSDILSNEFRDAGFDDVELEFGEHADQRQPSDTEHPADNDAMGTMQSTAAPNKQRYALRQSLDSVDIRI